MVLDYAACGYVAYRLGVPLLRAIPNVREYEAKRLRKFRERGVSYYISRVAPDLALVAAACLIAWQRAGLGLLWLGIAVLLTILAASSGFAWAVGKVVPAPPLDLTSPLTEEQLDEFAKSRVWKNVVQFLLLSAWFYSWRHLAFE